MSHQVLFLLQIKPIYESLIADSPVKTVSVLKRLMGLFVKISSMQQGLFGFL